MAIKRIGINGASVFNLYGRKNVWYKEFDVVEGLDLHIPKGYIYFAMAFSLGVEIRDRGDLSNPYLSLTTGLFL
jgi:hypothetical protein